MTLMGAQFLGSETNHVCPPLRPQHLAMFSAAVNERPLQICRCTPYQHQLTDKMISFPHCRFSGRQASKQQEQQCARGQWRKPNIQRHHRSGQTPRSTSQCRGRAPHPHRPFCRALGPISPMASCQAWFPSSYSFVGKDLGFSL
jgi:hypothetical protein